MKKFMVLAILGLALAFFSGKSFADMPCGADMQSGMEKMDCCNQEPMHMMGGGMMGKGMDGGEPEDMMGGMEDEHRHMMHIFANLGLDEKQMETLSEIRIRTMKDMIRKKADKEIAAFELKGLLHKDPVDLKAVEAKLKQKENIKTDILLTVIKAMEEAKSKLTPEQKMKMKDMIEKRHAMDGMGDMMCKCHEEKCHSEDKKEEKKPLEKHKH